MFRILMTVGLLAGVASAPWTVSAAAGQVPAKRAEEKAEARAALRPLELRVALQEARLALARARQAAALATAKEAQARLDRLERLRAAQSGVVSDEAYQAGVLTRNRYRAEEAIAQAQVRVAEVELELARVRLQAEQGRK